jgi:hypothetical protein
MRWWQIKKRYADLERELRSGLELEEDEQRDNPRCARKLKMLGHSANSNSAHSVSSKRTSRFEYTLRFLARMAV